jgi:ribosomal protein L9
MKIQIIKDVYSGTGWRKEGDIIEVDPKTARHYLIRGIAIEYKEEKIVKETKEAKTPKKRITKAKK